VAEITTETIEVAAEEVAMAENATEAMVAAVVEVAFTGAKEVTMAEAMVWNTVITRDPITLVYQIEVQEHLFILNRNSHLHGLILVCTFINIEKIFPLHIYDLKNKSNISLKLLLFASTNI
jgi:hypothetical protein